MLGLRQEFFLTDAARKPMVEVVIAMLGDIYGSALDPVKLTAVLKRHSSF